MAGITLTQDLVLRIDSEGMSSSDVEKIMAETLVKQGFAKDSYPTAILEREKNYPTALYMEEGGINAAVPHCDIEHVNQASVCVAFLSSPVEWYRMDEPEESCGVSLVCMLALTEAHAHIDMLTKVIGFVQQQDTLKELLQEENREVLFNAVQKYLADPQ